MEENSKFVSLIIEFEDATYLCYTRGRFDCWRVSFMDNQSNIMESPKDTYFFDYYLSLTEFGASTQQIFKELKKLSKFITKDTSTEFQFLRKGVKEAAENLYILNRTQQIRFEKATMALLAAMLSEEKKQFTKLGKKLKLLGLHQVLVGGMSPTTAASWSKGKPWREIQAEYERLGV